MLGVCFGPASRHLPWPQPWLVHSCRQSGSFPPAASTPCRPGLSVRIVFCLGSLHQHSVNCLFPAQGPTRSPLPGSSTGSSCLPSGVERRDLTPSIRPPPLSDSGLHTFSGLLWSSFWVPWQNPVPPSSKLTMELEMIGLPPFVKKTIHNNQDALIDPTRLQFLQTAYTQNIFMSHDFWNLRLKVQNYMPNLQNHKLFLSLWLSFQLHKTLFSKHTTHNSLPKTQRSIRKWLAFLFQTQPIKMLHLFTRSHRHTPHMCKH